MPLIPPKDDADVSKKDALVVGQDAAASNQSRHTPGPWRATGSAANYTPPQDRHAREDMADWSSGVDGPLPFTENEYDDYERRDEQQVARGYGRTVDEAQANARLIAAAPDLLAALRELAEVADDIAGNENPSRGEVERYELALEAARQAIAKAEASDAGTRQQSSQATTPNT